MSLRSGRWYFETRPFVTVIGDNGEEIGAHASRFKVVEN